MDDKLANIMAAYLEDSQDLTTKLALEAALRTGELDANELAAIQDVDARLQTLALALPAPSETLRTNFYLMLAREKQKQRAATSWRLGLQRFIDNLLPAISFGKVSYSLLVLAIGIVLGLRNQHFQGPETEKMAALTLEVQQLKKMMMLTLLEQPSTTERLQAINLTTDMGAADNRVIQALLQTLNNDISVNVRLAAIEALYQHAHNPVARQGLVESIGKQDAPLVQLALADIMLAMQHKGAVKQLQQLLKKEGLNEDVKAKVKQTIQVLI